MGGWPRFMVDYGDAILGNVKKRRGVRALAFFDVRVWLLTVVGDLVDLDDTVSVLLLLVEHDSKNAILKFGTDGSLVFLDGNWQGDSTGELAPVTFLNMPGGRVFVFAAAENARDREDILGDRDIEVGFGNAGRAGFNY